MDIVKLPHDVFVVLVSYLSPRTCVRCRAVSRDWKAAFTGDVVSLLLLRWHFPRCRELRLSTAAATLLGSGPDYAPATSPVSDLDVDEVAAGSVLPANLRAELLAEASSPRDWAVTLAAVARRYWYLRRARPWKVEKLALAASGPLPGRELGGGSGGGSGGSDGSGFCFYGFAPWDRHLRLNDKTAEFHYPDPKWSYSQEDGVLVYPADLDAAAVDGRVYQVLDLATGQREPVPFDVRHKVVRRVRLAQGVLVFEWAEAMPRLRQRRPEPMYLHLHFVTAFDIVRIFQKTEDGLSPRWTWTVSLRSEWGLYYPGLPLDRVDRFFSTHTATHYAVFFWLPSCMPYHDPDDPVQRLVVWDISSPSPHSPSIDLCLRKLRRQPRAGGVGAGPRVIRSLLNRDLGFYRLSQSKNPRLCGLALDETNIYVLEEDHRWVQGPQGSRFAPRVHLVRCIGIPIVPLPTTTTTVSRAVAESVKPVKAAPSVGTTLVASGGGGGGGDNRDDDETEAAAPISDDLPRRLSYPPVYGPHWADECGANGDVNLNFCQRVHVMNSVFNHGGNSGDSTPRFAPQMLSEASPQPSWPWALSTGQDVTAPTAGPDHQHSAAGAGTRTGTGRGSGTAGEAAAALLPRQRWPGWAPCWRHEDFPYLTVSEMLDFAAGVRVAARRCFMLETLSVHVRPALWVRGGAAAAVDEDDEDDEDEEDNDGYGGGDSRSGSGNGSHNRSTDDNHDDNARPSERARRKKGGGAAGVGSGVGGASAGDAAAAAAAATREVQFPDELWAELLGKGHIAGDERWLVGEELAPRHRPRDAGGGGGGERETVTIVRF